VEGQRAAPEENVLLFDEGNRLLSQEQKPLRRPHGLDARGDGVDVDGLRLLAQQAENYRLVGAVSLARRTERAEELGAHCGDPGQQPIAPEPQRKLFRRLHRADGVRAGRADADFEKVEDAD